MGVIAIKTIEIPIIMIRSQWSAIIFVRGPMVKAAIAEAALAVPMSSPMREPDN